MIKGISFLNPVDVEEGYMKKCAEYAISHGVKHFELIGPTHHPVKGNCDGMMLYRKYAQFNEGKDVEYIKYCERVVNEVLDMIEPYGIKSYYWHHEMEVPLGFDEVYPEIHNADGDVEVTHPRLKDFLVNKIEDFFYTYPKMTGIVLTLHETRIPLLKLKNQKLGKVERVKYVTEILHETCKRLGKELIVRPFASIAQDYDDLMDAYEQVSRDMLVCDKWCKYDWSLTKPHNPFLARIKNPLIVETDIFGEYYGKGFVPIMLKKHIIEKVKYCNAQNAIGYVSRIDRDGYIPFDTPNEVNLEIMDAAVEGRDVDEAIDAFFRREYGEYGDVVKAAMEDTEDLQVQAMCYRKRGMGNLSMFPSVHAMKTKYKIFREDYVSAKADSGVAPLCHEKEMEEKAKAVKASGEKLALIETLKGKLPEDKYYSVYMRFKNLHLVAKIFEQLAIVNHGIARYFEHKDEDAIPAVHAAIAVLKELDREGYEALGKDFYCERLSIKKGHPWRALNYGYDGSDRDSHVYHFERIFKHAFDSEVAKDRELRAQNLTDYVIAGGFSEEHGAKREPNFSAAFSTPEGPCRSAGSERGAYWSHLKAHGWFSYEMKVRPDVPNTVVVSGKGENGTLNIDLGIDGDITRHSVTGEGIVSVERTFTPAPGTDKVTVKIERCSSSMPLIYTVVMK